MFECLSSNDELYSWFRLRVHSLSLQKTSGGFIFCSFKTWNLPRILTFISEAFSWFSVYLFLIMFAASAHKHTLHSALWSQFAPPLSLSIVCVYKHKMLYVNSLPQKSMAYVAFQTMILHFSSFCCCCCSFVSRALTALLHFYLFYFFNENMCLFCLLSSFCRKQQTDQRKKSTQQQKKRRENSTQQRNESFKCSCS